MKIKGKIFIVATLLFLSISLLATYVVSPFSIFHFVGPAAGVASAIVIAWGIAALWPIVFASFLYFVIHSFSDDKPIYLSVAVISLLAIILQATWARHLTSQVVRHQRWLKSRENLFIFVLKLGPLASAISAFSALIIVVLDNQSIHGSFLYVFVITWASSMLFTLFLTPLLLFTQDNQPLSVTKRVFVSIASILAAIAIGLLFRTSQNVQQHQRLDDFKEAKESIQQSLSDELSTISMQINALSAYFSATTISKNSEVTFASFSLFAKKILLENPTISALEWAPIVKQNQRAQFVLKTEQQLQHPFHIIEQMLTGELKVSPTYDWYAPITYIYPMANNYAALGLDLNSQPDSLFSINQSVQRKQIIASPPLKLVQDDFSNLGVLIFSTIFNQEGDHHLNEMPLNAKIKASDHRQVAGYVIGVAQFKPFFDRIMKEANVLNIDVFVQDTSDLEPYIIYGHEPISINRKSEEIFIDVLSRQWQVVITEKQAWITQQQNWQAWSMIIGSTLGGSLFQLLILMMAVYSTELSGQVAVKTREIILAKEDSETKNIAKTKFLNTLNDELFTPINAIKGFAKQLKSTLTTVEQESVLKNINRTTANMLQLLDTVKYVSNIESGHITLNEETFDFYSFLKRIEVMLNAHSSIKDKTIFFLIHEEVPHFIDSDELRIQKLLIALIEAGQMLFNGEYLRLSVKAHTHQMRTATIFLVFTSQENETMNTGDQEKVTYREKQQFESDKVMSSTPMTMVKQVCQLMQGDVNYSELASGDCMLSASFKISMTSLDQQQAFQDLSFTDDSETQNGI